MKRKIMIIGAGGIGSMLIHNLERLGIYDITVYDDDKVEYKNIFYQHYESAHIGLNKAKAIKKQFTDVKAEPYLVLVPKQLKGYDLVICCADNLDVRRLLYRQGTGDDANVKWLDLRAQGRNATLISYMLNPDLVDTVLTGEEGSFSCQAQSWDGSAEGVNMMNNVIASVAAQWIQKWFNKQEVSASMVYNI
tara:strand:- start:21022 stop:21597 length:576 start_codon:yes stop_codon:yes gene_type:complete